MLYFFERYLNSNAGAVHGANVGEIKAVRKIFSMLEPIEFVLCTYSSFLISINFVIKYTMVRVIINSMTALAAAAGSWR